MVIKHIHNIYHLPHQKKKSKEKKGRVFIVYGTLQKQKKLINFIGVNQKYHYYSSLDSKVSLYTEFCKWLLVFSHHQALFSGAMIQQEIKESPACLGPHSDGGSNINPQNSCIYLMLGCPKNTVKICKSSNNVWYCSSEMPETRMRT